MGQPSVASARRVPGTSRGATLWRQIVRNRWGYFFILPKYIFFLVFVGFPVIWAFVLSFQEFQVFDTVWVGFGNFVRVFQSELFWIAFWNTLKYTVVVVPAMVLTALFLASLIFPLSPRMQTFYRAAYYLPTVTSVLVLAMVWRWMYNPSYGLLNYLLSLFGIPPVNWLGSSATAMWSIILMTVLTPPGVGVIMYLAAMGSIPEEVYEAARIDGAGFFRRWWHITVPLLKPTTLYLVVLETIGSFQVFTQVLMMTQGGPGHSTTTLVTLIYDTAFRDFKFGQAAAQSMVLFAVTMLIAWVQFRFLRSDVEY